MRLALRSLVFVAWFGSASSAAASPIAYQFRVDGFPDGAYLLGGFSGEDINGDGVLFTNFMSWPPPFEIPNLGANYYDADGDFLIGAGGLFALGAFARFDLATNALTFSLELWQGPPFPFGNINHNQVVYWGERPCPPELTPNPCTQLVMLGGGTTQAPQVWRVPDHANSFALLVSGLAVVMVASLWRLSMH